MAKFLDAAGITHLITKLKSIFATKEEGTHYEVLKCTVGQIPSSPSYYVPIADLSKLTYPAGQAFNQFLIPTGAKQVYARFQGYIITGANTCIVTPSFRNILAGGAQFLRPTPSIGMSISGTIIKAS